MTEEPSLLGQILLSMKIMSEPALLTLRAVVQQELQTRYRHEESADQAQDYEITVRVALADLRITPLNNASIQYSLPQLNDAELSLVSFALSSYLRCDDIPEEATASEQRKSGLRGVVMMVPIRGPMRKDDRSDEARSKRTEMYRAVQHEFDAGNKEKALALLDEYISSNEHLNQPTFGLKLHREVMFFHQSGDYEAVISLCEQSLAENLQTGNLFGQVNALETMAFAALRMGQKPRATSYLDQIEERFAMPAPGDIAQMTAYFNVDSEAKTLALLRDRVKSAKQLQDLLSE